MDDAGERLVDALQGLQEVATDLTPDEAVDALDDATLQIFWRDWPDLSSWAGALWRRVDADLAEPSGRPQDDLDEIGGEGG